MTNTIILILMIALTCFLIFRVSVLITAIVVSLEIVKKGETSTYKLDDTIEMIRKNHPHSIKFADFVYALGKFFLILAMASALLTVIL